MFVFVYGSLKKGYGNNRLLEFATLIGSDETTSEDYELRCWGAYPAVYKGGVTSIKGEVYEIDDNILRSLDSLEGYPSFYNRELVSLKSGRDAWMYYIDAHHYFERRGVVCHDGLWEPYR